MDKIEWTRKRESGFMTYRFETEKHGVWWSMAVDRPYRSGRWVVRGWRNGVSALYREAPTLREAKELAECAVISYVRKDGAS